MLSFELTMPNVGSWNGKWTGEGQKRYRTRRVVKAKEVELANKSYYYNFGDGWGASVIVESVDSKEAVKRRRKSAGFAGYDWMIDEILEHGRILTLQERKAKNSE